MPEPSQSHSRNTALVAVKLVHTAAWALFAACIVGMPFASVYGAHGLALTLASIVAVEVVVLACNRWQCPLTPIAARYTDDRTANFDIYLPVWLARHNKTIFGAIYVVGLVFIGVIWMRQG